MLAWLVADCVSDELPEDVRKTLLEETGGFVQDKLKLDYDHWLSSE